MKKILRLKQLSTLLVFAIVFTSCEDEMPIPKPPTYLRVEIPPSVFKSFTDDCGFELEMPDNYSIDTSQNVKGACNKVIDLGPLNGSMFIYYWDVEEPLSYYINNANDEVGNHKLKATRIEDNQIKRPHDRVFGTQFELQGNVATPFQFYLTDSTDRFLFAEVLFNCTPNYDSLKPTLDRFKTDLDHMLKTFRWN